MKAPQARKILNAKLRRNEEEYKKLRIFVTSRKFFIVLTRRTGVPKFITFLPSDLRVFGLKMPAAHHNKKKTPIFTGVFFNT